MKIYCRASGGEKFRRDLKQWELSQTHIRKWHHLQLDIGFVGLLSYMLLNNLISTQY